MDRSGKIVLVVDDDDNTREALARVLRHEGYSVHVARSGPEALQIVEQQPIQLVLSDYDMPEMTGLDLFVVLHERYPDICRIMVTGKADTETVVRSINDGEVYRFIQKPWDNSVLRVTVHFAFETIALQAENRLLLAVMRRQLEMVREMEGVLSELEQPPAGAPPKPRTAGE